LTKQNNIIKFVEPDYSVVVKKKGEEIFAEAVFNESDFSNTETRNLNLLFKCDLSTRSAEEQI
jgi:hypothetical protein